MELLTEKIGDITVVVLPGEQLDAGNAKDFKRDIGPVLEPCSKVVFDLRELPFVAGCASLTARALARSCPASGS